MDSQSLTIVDKRVWSSRIEHCFCLKLFPIGMFLHARFLGLPADDRRREAWISAGRGSRQWATSHPTERLDLEGDGGMVFRVAIAQYLGVECPVAREDAALGLTLAGPRTGAQAGVDTPVDAHGVEVSRAILPGGSMTYLSSSNSLRSSSF